LNRRDPENIKKIVKACGTALSKVTLLKRRVAELETAQKHQTKKKGQSGVRLQETGVLTVGEGLDRIAAAATGNVGGGNGGEPSQRTRALPKCGLCRQEGHYRTSCSSAMDTF
jgi:hypothetical protein